MSKTITTKIKIPFIDPHVIRLEHQYDENSMTFLKLKRNVSRFAVASWGYSDIIHESSNYNDDGTPVLLNIGPYKSIHHFRHIQRSYWCFCDKADALQFKLMADNSAINVKMWPAILFTIHEITPDINP